MDVRTNIKEYLTQHGITVKWLSDKIHMSMVSLSTTLNQKRILKADEYFKICNALNVSYNTFAPKNNKTIRKENKNYGGRKNKKYKSLF